MHLTSARSSQSCVELQPYLIVHFVMLMCPHNVQYVVPEHTLKQGPVRLTLIYRHPRIYQLHLTLVQWISSLGILWLCSQCSMWLYQFSRDRTLYVGNQSNRQFCRVNRTWTAQLWFLACNWRRSTISKWIRMDTTITARTSSCMKRKQTLLSLSLQRLNTTLRS